PTPQIGGLFRSQSIHCARSVFIFWRPCILKQGDSAIAAQRLADHPGTSATSQFEKNFFFFLQQTHYCIRGMRGAIGWNPCALMLFLVWAHLSLALTYPIRHARRLLPKNELLLYN